MTATAAPAPSSQGTVFTVLFAVALCHGINDTMQAVLLSVYPMLRDNYALTFAQVGMITLVFQVTASILQPFVGIFTDRYPLPYSLPVAPLCTLGGLLLLAHAHSYPAILVAAAMIGIGSSRFHPDASRVSRLSAGGRFGFAQSTFQVGGNLGTAIGPLLAAVIVLPRGQQAISWFAVLAFVAFLLLSHVGRWYAGWLRDHARKATSKMATHSLNRRQIAGALFVLLVLMFSKFVYTSSLHSFYSFYLIDHFKVTPQDAQVYLFVLFGSMAVGTFMGGPIGDRIGTKAVIWMSILGALPFTLALPYTNLFWTVALTIPIGFIISSAFSAMVVYAQELVPGRVGMISGLFFGLAFGVAGLGAAVLGVVADHTSIDFVFRLCSFLPALGMLAFFLPRTR
ncbi:MAG: MFS transporter [Rhizobiales bacterium]|nr:MFS transporter [Hyphomicrobiales bacterium]